MAVDDGAEPTTRETPPRACDVVMKGGITSGVVYPGALHRISQSYRIRGIGGASAGAIGAAAGAAAEHGRATGGFERLADLPGQLSDGALARLFQPEHRTKSLLPLLLAITAGDRPGPPPSKAGQVLRVLLTAWRVFPLASLLGIAPGLGLAIHGSRQGGILSVALVGLGIALVALGWMAAMVGRLWWALARDLPANLYGICRGRGSNTQQGFTDWLADQIDDLAGRSTDGRPLTFGHLWRGPENDAVATSDAGDPGQEPEDRRIDLRMITTCLSEGRPYEMPWQAARFFFDPAEWGTLFPKRVVEALLDAPAPAASLAGIGRDGGEARLEDEQARRHLPRLHRLPEAADLPVIVATRLSLSFPLLISAVPVYSIVHRRSADGDVAIDFRRLVFTDGGFCSNFPLHMFDAPLPRHPTFAINLGSLPKGQEPAVDPSENIEWSSDNRPISPTYRDIPSTGLSAATAFASAAFNTARNWQDNSYLAEPGFRDRIVRVLQSTSEGGMNLHMDSETIDGLSARGAVAASALIEQFEEPRYPRIAPTATGWDNHLWVRYRALMAVLPDWLEAHNRGRATVASLTQVGRPSFSYELTTPGWTLADLLDTRLAQMAADVQQAGGSARQDLASAPRPQGILRRVPQM